jgi:hypothetical protein
VRRLVYLDADHGKLRAMKDAKQKTPSTYDDRGQYKDVFETIWDAAKLGNCTRLK